MANERERFEAQREDSLEQCMSRSTIMRFGDAGFRARADFRAGFHAGWQAHAESVGIITAISICPSCEGCGIYNFHTCAICDGSGRINEEGLPYSHPAPESESVVPRVPYPGSYISKEEVKQWRREAESLSGDGPNLALLLREWMERADFIRYKPDRSIHPTFDELLKMAEDAQPASIEKAGPENELHYLPMIQEISCEFNYPLIIESATQLDEIIGRLAQRMAPTMIKETVRPASIEKAQEGDLFSEALELLDRARGATDSLHCMKAIEAFQAKCAALQRNRGKAVKE